VLVGLFIVLVGLFIGLNGQKLQGTLTVKEVMEILRKDGTADKYPLFKSIHAIAFEGAPAESMLATLGPVLRLVW
jgi:glycerol-3-phosphate dehydrogenase